MNVNVHIDKQSGKVAVSLPDRSLDGARLTLDLDLLDALQLHSALGREIERINA